MRLKKIPLIILFCLLASAVVIFLYIMGFNFLTIPPKSSEALLEEHMQEDNLSSLEDENGGGILEAIIAPRLSYFTFVLSFSANLKNDKNIMNMEVALSTFEGEFYLARLTHHEPALRRVILDTLSETPEESARTKKGKDELAAKLLSEINLKLEFLSEKPAIEGVHFTAFAVR